jgi:phage tail-like protein
LPAGFATYETLIQQARGRFLRVRLTLSGNGERTPRVRAARVWYPRFSYLDRYLPAIYREDPGGASFLERFLANAEGTLTGIEDKIASARALIDPRTAPAEALDWLAGWLGAVLDPSWDEARRRLFVRRAVDLFRLRGTIRGLQIAIHLALDACVGDPLIDGTTPGPEPYRIVEAFQVKTSTATAATVRAAAHRFTVLLPAPVAADLTQVEAEQQTRLRVEQVVSLEKPAHTAFDVAFYRAAWRVGGVRLGSETVVGPGSRDPAFDQDALMGDAFLGESYLRARSPGDATDRLILGRDSLFRTRTGTQTSNPADSGDHPR